MDAVGLHITADCRSGVGHVDQSVEQKWNISDVEFIREFDVHVFKRANVIRSIIPGQCDPSKNDPGALMLEGLDQPAKVLARNRDRCPAEAIVAPQGKYNYRWLQREGAIQSCQTAARGQPALAVVDHLILVAGCLQLRLEL